MTNSHCSIPLNPPFLPMECLRHKGDLTFQAYEIKADQISIFALSVILKIIELN
jgi:hypothetical protein